MFYRPVGWPITVAAQLPSWMRGISCVNAKKAMSLRSPCTVLYCTVASEEDKEYLGTDCNNATATAIILALSKRRLGSCMGSDRDRDIIEIV